MIRASGDERSSREVVVVSTDAAARQRGNHVGETIRTDEIYLTSAGFAEPNKEVVLGSWAKLEDLDSGAQSRFEVVSSAESNPSQGRISIESPVGRAIFGRHPGETVEVITPKGRRHLKVLAIEPHDESASRLPPGPPHPS